MAMPEATITGRLPKANGGNKKAGRSQLDGFAL
jgi:hypothetical protein